MSQTKYITSGGLAFSENKDMEKLRKYSLKGWHVRDFKFMGYTLEKGVSSDYVYSVDYRSLKAEEEEEYFDFFSSAGWSHVASEADIHLFRANPGTKPIYTDHDTRIEKYKSSIDSIRKFAVPFVLMTILAWIGTMLSSGSLESVLLVVAVILSVIALPMTWTVVATYHNKWKVEGREKLVNFMKLIPALLLIISVIILLVFNESGTIINLLLYMIIGGTLPIAIWAIMSLYHKFREKSN
ncbi:DUF2812 domain-containing protein [Pueribacillus sp. YX66]|uniref:DUF2812 domain-containing protein n=1 Tax=Pueribacillus sp. YX66 TaxID=3229242 RepID=UPI00358D8DE5